MRHRPLADDGSLSHASGDAQAVERLSAVALQTSASPHTSSGCFAPPPRSSFRVEGVVSMAIGFSPLAATSGAIRWPPTGRLSWPPSAPARVREGSAPRRSFSPAGDCSDRFPSPELTIGSATQDSSTGADAGECFATKAIGRRRPARTSAKATIRAVRPNRARQSRGPRCRGSRPGWARGRGAHRRYALPVHPELRATRAAAGC